ncbi:MULTISPECIES: hypothetical protein [unclassified Ruegeria]|uniref:hypothetical protein n=1 Tax=unclassified Ruegeria TaxID=2625375 RepID=UPI0014890E76|nr:MULTISPECIES: hypothetical protein [unclassified Ruegeria]
MSAAGKHFGYWQNFKQSWREKATYKTDLNLNREADMVVVLNTIFFAGAKQMPIVSLNKKHSLSRFKKKYSAQTIVGENGAASTPSISGEFVVWDENPGRKVRDVPFTFSLFQKLAKSRKKLGLTALVGLYSVEYELDKKLFGKEMLECAERLKSNVHGASWYDAIFLLMTARHVENHEYREWAVKWLTELSKKISGFDEQIKYVSEAGFRDLI